jgi:hypothetical protein
MNFPKRAGFYYLLNLLLFVCSSSLYAFAQAPRATPVPRDDTQSWNEVQITVPLKKWVDLVASGQLRLGRNLTDFVDERGGMGLVFKVNQYLSLSPGYLHIATQPTSSRKAFENRLNFAATVQFPLGRFTVTDRNLFERRLRSPVDSTRYRNRIQIATPLPFKRAKLNLYLAEEVFYDWSVTDWVRNRVSAGVTRKMNKNLTLDLYYLRQNDGRSRPGDLHVVGTVFRVRL